MLSLCQKYLHTGHPLEWRRKMTPPTFQAAGSRPGCRCIAVRGRTAFDPSTCLPRPVARAERVQGAHAGQSRLSGRALLPHFGEERTQRSQQLQRDVSLQGAVEPGAAGLLAALGRQDAVDRVGSLRKHAQRHCRQLPLVGWITVVAGLAPGPGPVPAGEFSCNGSNRLSLAATRSGLPSSSKPQQMKMPRGGTEAASSRQASRRRPSTWIGCANSWTPSWRTPAHGFLTFGVAWGPLRVNSIAEPNGAGSAASKAKNDASQRANFCIASTGDRAFSPAANAGPTGEPTARKAMNTRVRMPRLIAVRHPLVRAPPEAAGVLSYCACLELANTSATGRPTSARVPMCSSAVLQVNGA